MKKLGILTAGIFKENPVFVLMLGLCPTLGVTSSAINGFSMGLAVIAVLACSNGLISLFKKFIPLIVVNCIVLGRAESFASKNGVIDSILDGIGSGIGFTLSLTFLGSIREILGNGSIFGISLVPANFTPALIFILAPGGFITIGMIMACINIKKERDAKKKKVTKK